MTIGPNVVIGPGVTLEDGAEIRPFSHLEGVRVGRGALIGPFARLRPGSEIGEEARVGNFVEVKNSRVERGAKINHLSYVGDAGVGAGANIGAGTITCNYDGYEKSRTEIGEGAFIGSNTALVAPVYRRPRRGRGRRQRDYRGRGSGRHRRRQRRAAPARRRGGAQARPAPTRPGRALGRAQEGSAGAVCGIIGVTGPDQAAPHILDGLRRLEYRGYDSAGLATLANGLIELRRAEGKLIELERLVDRSPVSGTVGHRAHPLGHAWRAQRDQRPPAHAAGRVAVVHNGIIENYRELRAKLEAEGRELVSDTDTEVVPHLIDSHMERGLDPEQATAATLAQLEGAFALAIIFAGHAGLLIGARRGSPLAIGHGEDATYLASDALALSTLRPPDQLSRRGRLGGAQSRRGRHTRCERAARRRARRASPPTTAP